MLGSSVATSGDAIGLTTFLSSVVVASLFSFFFCYQQFLFLFFSHTTQQNIQNKTKQNSRHILNISRFNQKGGREGRTTRTQKVTPLNNYVYSTKNTAKPQWLKDWPHRLVPLYIHMTQFAGGYGSNMPLYTCVV